MHGERASGRAAGVNPGTSREPAAALSPAAFAHPPRTCPGAADKGRRAQPRRRGARPDPGSSGSPRRTPARFTTTPSSFPPGASAAPGGLKPPGPAPTAEGASRVGPGLPSSPRYPQPGSGEPRYLPPPPRSPAGTLPGVRGCPASPLPAPHGSARAAPATGPRAKPAQGTAAEPPQHQVRRAQPALVSARGLPGRVARLPPPPSTAKSQRSFLLVQIDRQTRAKLQPLFLSTATQVHPHTDGFWSRSVRSLPLLLGNPAWVARGAQRGTNEIPAKPESGESCSLS